ncbi:MAG TPA: hypothetical protein VGH40_22690 [Roseiarcus sp.]|jgi:hypothetical protein
MKRMIIAGFALLSISSAAFAQTAPYSRSIAHQQIAQAAASTMSLHPSDHYVRNANNCGMELSRAVWGPNGTLLGYGCYRDSNG